MNLLTILQSKLLKTTPIFPTSTQLQFIPAVVGTPTQYTSTVKVI